MSKQKNETEKRSSIWKALLLFVVACPASILIFLWSVDPSLGTGTSNDSDVVEIEETADLYADVRNRILEIEGVQSVDNISIEALNPGTNTSVAITVDEAASTPLTAVTIFGITLQYAVDNIELHGVQEFELLMMVDGVQSRWTPAGGDDWTIENLTAGTTTIDIGTETDLTNLFIELNFVSDVLIATERDNGNQINAFVLVRVLADDDVIESRNDLLDVWMQSARDRFGDEVRLDIDLTLNQGSDSYHWQYSSDSAEWIEIE